MCLFLTNLEIPIATTALVDITQDLGGFVKASWVISAYLVGYVGKTSYVADAWLVLYVRILLTSILQVYSSSLLS